MTALEPAMQGLSATGQAGGQQWSLSLQTLLLLSAMAFLPAVLLMMTGFTRIIIVRLAAHGHRHHLGAAEPGAAGAGAVPDVFRHVTDPGPGLRKRLANCSPGMKSAWSTDKGSQPFRAFMLTQTRQGDLALFARVACLATCKAPKTCPCVCCCRRLSPAN